MKYNQNSILGDVEPGKRVRKVVNRVRPDDGPDMSQATNFMPSEPGPAVTGRTPAIGSVRRDRDIPVVRDNLPSLLD